MQQLNRIKEVWAENLEEEMGYIRAAIDKYPFVAMDTEFPGVVARPIGSFRGSSDYHYQTLRCNVDLLRIIQLGITLADENGDLAPGVCTWQFNFRFSINDDMYAPESIELLTKSGINFKRHEEYGISVEHFGELLISSGLVLLDEVQWVSFHSGYDFGYLLKIVSCSPLPPTETEFFELLRIWFPCIWDIKYLMKSCKTLKGGLQEVADDLQVARIGPQHQAGSDSLLTAATFFKMRDKFFENSIDSKFMGVLYGLNSSSTSANPAHPREFNGAVHYPISQTPTISAAAPLQAAASSAIAIMSPSPKTQPRHRCTVTAPAPSPDAEGETVGDAHLPCDACRAANRECLYGVVPVTWQGRTRSYGVMTEIDERLTRLEKAVQAILDAEEPQVDMEEEPALRDAADDEAGIRRVEGGVRRSSIEMDEDAPEPEPEREDGGLYSDPSHVSDSITHEQTTLRLQGVLEFGTLHHAPNPVRGGGDWTEPLVNARTVATTRGDLETTLASLRLASSFASTSLFSSLSLFSHSPTTFSRRRLPSLYRSPPLSRAPPPPPSSTSHSEYTRFHPSPELSYASPVSSWGVMTASSGSSPSPSHALYPRCSPTTPTSPFSQLAHGSPVVRPLALSTRASFDSLQSIDEEPYPDDGSPHRARFPSAASLPTFPVAPRPYLSPLHPFSSSHDAARAQDCYPASHQPPRRRHSLPPLSSCAGPGLVPVRSSSPTRNAATRDRAHTLDGMFELPPAGVHRNAQ
ncbi:hypothetical protein JCM21900_000913 [Sporobolomyces salmonicolor]